MTRWPSDNKISTSKIAEQSDWHREKMVDAAEMFWLYINHLGHGDSFGKLKHRNRTTKSWKNLIK